MIVVSSLASEDPLDHFFVLVSRLLYQRDAVHEVSGFHETLGSFLGYAYG